ncbi:MAG: arginyltransferase [Proteobacteria bacterium]|nr:arginyltransferase [Pseudomonadota bacterium]
MSIERRNFPQFFITAPSPCPYVRGRMERKVFTHLVGPDSRNLNTQLSQGGFRRSQNIAYRPACDGCQACESTRIPVRDFRWSRGFRRVLARNNDVTATVVRAQATSEQYSLFRSYIDTRHSDGGMADMTVLDFAAMVDDTLVDSRIVEYRVGTSSIRPGELVASVLVDVLGDGLSMIYSFYEPGLAERSLGTFMVLDMIRRVERMGLPYVYLGYLVKDSHKMSYKARFLPQERLGSHGWIRHDGD